MTAHEHVGALVRHWRQRRRRSQLEISIATGVSTRHLSFIETGRSRPSRGMIERLCDELDVPLRERNRFFLAAGLAPVHTEHTADDLGEIRTAIDEFLAGHEPYPAVAVNARWKLLAANGAMSTFLSGVPAYLREPRPNMLRVTLHPDGLAPQLRNHAQWRAITLRRIRRQYERTADPYLADLLAELDGYSGRAGDDDPDGKDDPGMAPGTELATPMVLDTDFGRLSLLYAVTVFGSPRDVAVDEIAIETFVPADTATRTVLQRLSDLRS
ncbi:helix-turn-helix transcriptional regulator [Gordonia sp. PKS22-38]|uniref:Helix-turn-helix transcriptional regulator n=1 Tax=Gordonia prachuapensis TaxID=3115651 RepID=A0ABU7MS25_9ACTN|nr:helix-turn-helix transcriptional regulator [Gordonia sp. PKS22-38]